MAHRFDSKVVVVTGGTSGIGLATAKAFAAEGATLFITGRRQEALTAAIKQIGGRVSGVQGDMSKLADIASTQRQRRPCEASRATGYSTSKTGISASTRSAPA